MLSHIAEPRPSHVVTPSDSSRVREGACLIHWAQVTPIMGFKADVGDRASLVCLARQHPGMKRASRGTAFRPAAS